MRHALALAGVGVLLACCSSGGSGRQTATPPESGGAIVVTARDRHFTPESISVRSGAAADITFENDSSEQHTFTVYLGGTPGGTVVGDTGDVAPGDRGELSLLFKKGTHAFECKIHPSSMHGVIVVR